MEYVGISIGVVVGLISGIVVLALLRTLSKASINDANSIKTLTVQLLSVITVVAGASGAVITLYSDQEARIITSFYFYSLGIVYLVLMSYPLFRWIYAVGREIGE